MSRVPHVICPHSEDATVRVWDLATLRSTRCIRRVFGDAPVSSIAWLSGADGAASTRLFASAGCGVFGFDLSRPEVVLDTADSTYTFNTDEVNQVCVGRDGRGVPLLASADDSGGVCVVNLDTGKLVKVLRRHTMFASCIDVRSAGGGRPLQLVSGGFDCDCYVW